MEGRLILDDGAVNAVRDRHTSLLPAGISAVHGHFEAGDAVAMVSPDGPSSPADWSTMAPPNFPQMLGRSTRSLARPSAADMTA